MLMRAPMEKDTAQHQAMTGRTIVQLFRRNGNLAGRVVRSSLWLAGFVFLAAASASAAPDWCSPRASVLYPPGFFDYNRGLDLPQAFTTVGVYSPGGPYTQTVTLTVSGAGSVTCAPNNEGNVFGCPFYASLTEGAHTASYTCTAVDGLGNPVGSDTEQISFVMDNTPPVVAFTGPAPDTVFSPYSTITVRGSVQDITPLMHLGATSSNGPPSASRISGNNFEFDFCLTSSTSNFFSAYSTSALTVYIGATDSVGLGAYESYDSGVSSITVTIDGVPPDVAFAPDSIGTLTQITSIRGTASDNYKLDKVQLNIKENSSGRYWDGAQFVAGITTITIPLPQVENSPWEYTGLNPDEMQSDSSYTITATALDYFQGAAVVSAGLTLASTFLGEGVVADMFNGALVQFLVPPAPYMSLGQDAAFCVHYASPTLKNVIHFEEYPRNSLVVWPQSRPDPQCSLPDELLAIQSIIPRFSNPYPTLVTGCDDRSEIRAYSGSQIVGRTVIDIIKPKYEYAEITGFRNDFSQQIVAGIPPVPCPVGQLCIGYQHAVYVDKGSQETRPLDLRPDTMLIEKVITALVDGRCSNDTDQNNGKIWKLPDGRYFAKDFNGYRVVPRPPNCTDFKSQKISIGKCVVGSVDIIQRMRVINGGHYYFMTRSDRNPGSIQYPVSPP